MTAISAGGSESGYGAFTCAIAGAVKCWGRNFFGQLGNGSTTDSSTPVTVLNIGADTIAPESSMTELAATSSSAIALAWTGSDSYGTLTTYDVQVQADGGAWSTVLSGTSATSTILHGQLGSRYGFRVRARDAAGNVEAWPASAETSTVVSTTLPDGTPSPISTGLATSLTVPTTWLTGATATVQFAATSTGAAVDVATVRLASGAWSAWIDIAAGVTSSATLALGADGSAIPVSLVVRDANGAYSAVRSASLKVDRTSPGSSMTALAAVSSSAIVLAWSGSDATSGVASYDVQVQADGGAWSTVLSGTSATSMTYTGAADVTYGFRVRARDAAGNVEAWPASAETSTLVDLTGPAVPSGAVVLNGGVPATAVRTVDLALSASDTQSGVAEVRISDDGGSSWSAWQAYAASVDHTLPAGDGTKTVTVQFRDAVGNLSATRSDSITLDEAAGPEYGIALNRNALFTNVVTVEVMVGAPAHTREVMISNNGNFGGASWRPFDTRIDWEITSYGTSALPRVVYVKYKARDGTVSSTYLDDIILDQTAPVMQSLTSRLAPEAGDELAAPERAAAVPSLDPAAVWRIYVPRLASYGIPIALSVRASDDYSGVSEVQFSASSDFSGAWWQPYPTTGNAVWYAPSRPQQVWARVRDAAGNISSNVVSVRLP